MLTQKHINIYLQLVIRNNLNHKNSKVLLMYEILFHFELTKLRYLISKLFKQLALFDSRYRSLSSTLLSRKLT